MLIEFKRTAEQDFHDRRGDRTLCANNAARHPLGHAKKTGAAQVPRPRLQHRPNKSRAEHPVGKLTANS
jgi:hypothetical protein